MSHGGLLTSYRERLDNLTTWVDEQERVRICALALPELQVSTHPSPDVLDICHDPSLGPRRDMANEEPEGTPNKPLKLVITLHRSRKRGDDLTPVTLTQVSGVQQGDGSSHSGEDATCKVNKLKFQKLEARLLETRLRVSLFSVLTTSAQTYSALQS
ncbi:hypothetical protein KY284_001333 [Solanum tuberosum]|nr:hypothetical protein KY284_001333 [Solanum tuberosum]